MIPGIIAAVVALLAVAISSVIYARRASLASRVLERQLTDTQALQAKRYNEDLDRARVAADRLEARICRAGEEAASRLEDLGRSLDRLRARVGGLSAAVAGLHSNIAPESAALKIADHYSIDSGPLIAKPEEEIIALAETLAILRPLVPYPQWRFDADWANPDLAFQLRQRLWQYFSDRHREAAAVARWHYGTRLCLYLGNDLSKQIYIAGCIDPNEFAFLDRFLQPGMTFLDAGANEGVYTVFAAKRIGPQGTVWVFEPSQRELARLRVNLDLNNLSARIFPVALAEREGPAEMNIAGYGHEGLNSLGEFVYEIEETRKEMVQMARLDDAIAENPLSRLDVIKIDVEGAELRLLQGAAATVRRYRPLLLFEASDSALRQQGASREELFEYLRNLEYQIYLFNPYSGLPAPATAGAYSDNMIAAPAGIPLPDAAFDPWPANASRSTSET